MLHSDSRSKEVCLQRSKAVHTIAISLTNGNEVIPVALIVSNIDRQAGIACRQTRSPLLRAENILLPEDDEIEIVWFD